MTPHPFDALPAAVPDMVFTRMRQASEAGPRALNATVGMMLDDEGIPSLFTSVRDAARSWAEELTGRDTGYPALLGLPGYRSCVRTMVFHNDDSCIGDIAT